MLNRILMALYSAALGTGLTLSAPWWLLRMLSTAKYRDGLDQRLGRVPPALPQSCAGKRVVWVHAVSVGEVLAATRLVAELEAALGAGWVVVVSTTTQTGQTLAQQRFGADRVFYYPLDFAAPVRAYLKALRPAALVLMESEVWPRVLYECRRRGVPVTVANARVSDRSFTRGLRVRNVWRHVLGMVSLWCAQSDEDARRLVALGAPGDRVRMTGNLKYDVRAPKESRVAELIKEAAAGRPIIVAGSTLGAAGTEEEDEEWTLIDVMRTLRVQIRPLLVLAPRHPERFKNARAWALQLPLLCATELLSSVRTPESTTTTAGSEAGTKNVEIVVLDTIGDLAAVYGVADLAVVGGSLLPRGGHNPLEPAQFGVPVIMGDSFENFRDVVDTMRQAGAIRIVHAPDDLLETCIELLVNRDEARAMGERGHQVFESQQGATARVVDAVLGLVRA